MSMSEFIQVDYTNPYPSSLPPATLYLEQLRRFNRSELAIPSKEERRQLAYQEIAGNVKISQLAEADKSGVIPLQVGFLAREVAQRDLILSQGLLDKRRFLGLETEEEFISTVEQSLFDRMTKAGIAEDCITEVRARMDFAKANDKVREEIDRTKGKDNPGKRRTRESPYVHVLGATWLLWTKNEKEDISEEEKYTAVREVKVELIHDDLEDLLEYCTITELASGEYEILVNSSEICHSIVIPEDEYKLLRALTREPNKSNATTKIPHIEDISLRRSAADCKECDGLSNHPTMGYSGRSMLEVIGKMHETMDLGEIMERAKHSPHQPRSNLSPLTILASTEKMIILHELGVQLWDEIMNQQKSGEIWPQDLINIIQQSGIALSNGTEHYLRSLRGVDRITAGELGELIGFDTVFGTEKRLLEYNDFKNLATRQLDFFQSHSHIQGNLPGVIDTVYLKTK